MSPAPANEAATFPSPFFMSTTAVAPFSERECNGVIDCPAVSKAPTSACAMRRCTSFLDADDACLALSDKTSFLIPEDSFLSGQENFSTAACAQVALPVIGRAACCCASTGVHITSTVVPAASQHMPTPFFLMDTPVFGGEEEFAAASICFEKAVLALEMVVREPNAASLPGNAETQRGAPTFSDGARSTGRCASGTNLDVQHLEHHQKETPHFHQASARRVSSLSPSLPASQITGDIMDSFFPVMPYDQVAAASATIMMSVVDPDMADGADSAAQGLWRPAVHGPSTLRMAEVAGVAEIPGFTNPEYPEVVLESADCAIPAAPAPAPRAFHHKTGGPCDHCGATESPQWRRGPQTKPMLCNACGTRFRRTNQLNPAAALSPAGRAAAAAAAAAAAPSRRNLANKRDPPYVTSTSSKRSRSSSCY